MQSGYFQCSREHIESVVNRILNRCVLCVLSQRHANLEIFTTKYKIVFFVLSWLCCRLCNILPPPPPPYSDAPPPVSVGGGVDIHISIQDSIGVCVCVRACVCVCVRARACVCVS